MASITERESFLSDNCPMGIYETLCTFRDSFEIHAFEARIHGLKVSH